jgi:uncharacterized membrane protein
MMVGEEQISIYIAALRKELAPMTLEDREEILREITAHIRDSKEQTDTPVGTILARLGPPGELAAQYRDGVLIRRAGRTLSPIRLMRAALRLATKGVFGIAVFFLGIFGYAIGGGLVLTGIIKPIFPNNTGVWFENGHLVSSGVLLIPPPAPPAHEVLGMWYILIALVVGSLMLLLTSFLVRTCMRTSRKWQSKMQVYGA